MTGIVMTWVVGACAAAWVDWTVCGAALVVTALAALRVGALRGPLLAAVCGFLWFAFHLQGYTDLRNRASGELELVGTVVDLPDNRAEAARFTFAAAPGQGLDGATLRLSWFDVPAPIHAGDRLAITARLRPARGLANPRQFDFETWAFAAGIHATGYVRAGDQLSGTPPVAARLDRYRESVSRHLRGALEDPVARRLLPALAVADRRFLDDADWEMFSRTGTSHLLAISGLHIGLAAGLGIGLGLLVWRVAPGFATRRGLGLAFGLPVALVYAALAGFSLSTVRALIMLVVVCIVWWCRTGRSFRAGLTWAAAVVILLDPAAVASSGFWLSFGAVAVLAIAFMGRSSMNRWRRVFVAQSAVFLGLMPLTIGMALAPAWIAPVVNAIAIPWVAVVVVPPLLAAIACLPAAPALAGGLLDLAAWGVARLHQLLTVASSADLGPGVSATPEMLWLLPAIGLLALPRGVPGRLLAPLLMLAAFWPRHDLPAGDEVDLHVLDVGQGLALLVQTTGHALLYDTGPRSRSGWSAGSDIVAPFLRRQSGEAVDLLVVSHADADHAGGWDGLVEAGIRPRRILASQAMKSARSEPCLAGESWTWDQVRFEVLHPGPGLPYIGNDSSCVLLIEAGGRRILLPGDASDTVEARLVPGVGRLDVLVAGHHGSRTSTSAALVEATSPDWVIFSAGHGNRFGMPHAEVRDRLGGGRMLNTAECGYLHLRVGESGVSLQRAERAKRSRPWHPQDDAAENQYDCALQ